MYIESPHLAPRYIYFFCLRGGLCLPVYVCIYIGGGGGVIPTLMYEWMNVANVVQNHSFASYIFLFSSISQQGWIRTEMIQLYKFQI